ncbi:PspC domain-containing protein [Allosphingosinicella sp.]|jgi:phage shock protein PspC (stress-responsive transcriptional regulator)|uniref:PspC domain-containing protein n=1 Tax=Allosphingosinicella sp. TaxID=2823234 RepID=UPI002F0EA13F
MRDVQTNLFTRGDTFIGVCQGVGEDTGIPPDLLRLAFTALLFLAPVAALAGYAGLGAVVLASRLLFPVRSRTSARGQAAGSPVEANDEAAPEQVKLAA